MAEVIEAAVREANSKIVADHGFKLAIEPKVVLPTEEAAVEGVIAGKSDLAYTVEIEIVPPITLADFKTIKLTRLTAEVTDAEIDQALQTIAEQNRPFIAKTEGAEKGDRVTIRFRARSTARRSRAAPARTCRWCSARANSSPASRTTSRHQGRRKPDLRRQIPRRLLRRQRCRQERDLCGHGQGGGGAGRGHDRRRVRQDARLGVAGQAQGRGQGAHPARACGRLAPEAQARAARSARRAAQIRAAAEPGRAGIRQRLGHGREGPQGAGPHLRRRRNDRGKGARRIPRHRRAAGAARSGHRGDRRKEQYQGHRRAAHARP